MVLDVAMARVPLVLCLAMYRCFSYVDVIWLLEQTMCAVGVLGTSCYRRGGSGTWYP
jgi:hypothetical protein